MVTTAFEIDGYRVLRNLGIVRGITVRSRSVVGNFVA
ncbi:MAG TPA: heavy metal-binding domain-containing protein, partial [Terriglobales bacterium]|nr:heavy metal-binding domain-containing protein [Terriglobales bacterium]